MASKKSHDNHTKRAFPHTKKNNKNAIKKIKLSSF